MTVVNPFVRQFLVGWITVLDSVPEIDMLGFLPDFLEGNVRIFNLDMCISFLKYAGILYKHVKIQVCLPC